MENLVYTTQQIEQILNLINGISLVGIDNCNKISTIYQILNSGIKRNEDMLNCEIDK